MCKYQMAILYTSTKSVGFWLHYINKIIMFKWTPYDGVEWWGRVLALGGEDDKEDKIGRASCRERV